MGIQIRPADDRDGRWISGFIQATLRDMAAVGGCEVRQVRSTPAMRVAI